MRLSAFRVQMYRSIIDSGWVAVDPLTVIVGKNESGKTTLLRALYKLRPSIADPYAIEKEWPRSRRGERNPAQVVCTARFTLTDSERSDLEHALGQMLPADTVIEVARTYAGDVSVAVAGQPLLDDHARARVEQWMPTFIYMNDYHAFTGTANLNEVQQRKQQNLLTGEDTTLMAILELSGLDLDQEVQKGQSGDYGEREQRQLDLDDASERLTRTIADRWRQRKYDVQFRADGPMFFTFVRDERDPSLIKLEERSKGFQWFFSFDLMFMRESGGTFRDCVLLLDEPGLHLHPDAQQDLLRRLTAYAGGNTLIYSTHLPFMIDLSEPSRIRVLSESESGNTITDDLTQGQPEAKLVLQAALGMHGSPSWLVAERNLIVEGIDDYWLVSELSDLLVRSGEPGIPDDVLITPATSAAEAASIAAFMAGHRLRVAVVLDTDLADGARERLVTKWLARYGGQGTCVVSIGPAAGINHGKVAIEDLFPDDLYMSAVQDVYGKPLAALGITRLAVHGDGPIASRVERALTEHAITYNRSSVAKALRKRLAGFKTSSYLPPETQSRARGLIEAINACFTVETKSP